MKMKAKGSVSGGVLLIGGTCIGAGMLGLPVMTAAAGFYPTIGAFLLVWFFMTCSALAYLEVSLRLPGDTNLSSIAGHTLGHVPKIIAGVIFVLLLYALIAAYSSGGTTLLAHILGFDLKTQMHINLMTLLFVLLFAIPVYLGTQWLDRLNRLLMIGFIATFITLCTLAFNVGPTINLHPAGNGKYLFFTFQLIVTAFGFHNLIPSLKSYLHEDVKKLRITIILGGLLPLVVYAIWELIILHLIPTWGPGGLVAMLNSGVNPADAITDALAQYGEGVLLCQTWFAFFALTTCFMGVGLAIFDFFADAFRIKKHEHGKNRIGLCLLAFVPPTVYTMIHPQGFLLALEYAGVFAAIILIIYPVMMAWSARYIKKLPGEDLYVMGGGKLLLILTFLFGVFVVVAQIAEQMGAFPIPHN